MTYSIVHQLMREIDDLDTETAVFDVALKHQPHRDGFLAWVNFRSLGQPYHSATSTGDTPEEALENLRTTLFDKFMSRDYYMANVEGGDQ